MTSFAKVQTTLKQFVYFLHADWSRQPKLFGKFALRTDDAWPDTDFEVLRSVFWETFPCGTIYAQMTAPTCIDVEFRQLIGIRDEGQERSFIRAFDVWGRWRFGDGWESAPAEADPTPAPASSAAGDDQVMPAGGGAGAGEDQVIDKRQQLGLTPREMEVADLLADGLSHAEISRGLVITIGTVAVHSGNINEKLKDAAGIDGDIASPRQRQLLRTYGFGATTQ